MMCNGKPDFGSVIQSFGMLGIIGSLLFVGLEMRQTQKIAIAGQHQARSALTAQVVRAMDDKGFDVQSIYFEKNYDYEFSPIEISHRNAIHLGYFLYENDFYQFREGLMDQATWDSKIAGLKGLYNQCSMRSIYNTRSATFSKDFVEIIESFPDNCDNK